MKFEIDFSTEKGKKVFAIITTRIDKLIKHPVIQKRLNEMRDEGKTDEELRHWLTLCAISTLYGLPNADKDTQSNYLATKLIELSAECAVEKKGENYDG